MFAAWLLAWLARDPFIADWDGFDYAASVVQGTPSVLGLGRALFLASNRALWLIAHHGFGLPPEQAYLVLKAGVIAQSGPAMVGLYALYKELTADLSAALLASLLVVLSPLYIVYSGRGMSEIPGILWWSWSLWLLLRSLRQGRTGLYLWAAVLFGLSANVREFAVFYLPVVVIAGWLYGLCWVVSLAAGAVAVMATLAGPICWSLSWPDFYLPAIRTWSQLSAQERREHPVTIRNLWLLVVCAFLCSPVATLITPAVCHRLYAKIFQEKLKLEQAQRVVILIGFFGLLAVIVLVANHDLAVNPRYLLTGLIGLAPLCGWWLAAWIKPEMQWRRMKFAALAALTLISLIGTGFYLHSVQWPQAEAAREYVATLSTLPDNAVFIVGRHTPLVNFYQRIGARPHWQAIPSGSGWPDDRLEAVIDSHLAEGRPVYVDLDEKLWNEGMREHRREAAGLELIRQRYELGLMKNSLYRLNKRLSPPRS